MNWLYNYTVKFSLNLILLYRWICHQCITPTDSHHVHQHEGQLGRCVQLHGFPNRKDLNLPHHTSSLNPFRFLPLWHIFLCYSFVFPQFSFVLIPKIHRHYRTLIHLDVLATHHLIFQIHHLFYLHRFIVKSILFYFLENLVELLIIQVNRLGQLHLIVII